LSKAKQKGTLAETALAEYLKQTWPAVERRALNGANDKGDIAGVPGFVVEVKNHRTYRIAEWLKETEEERLNAGEPNSFLVVKPNRVGTSKVGSWWAVLEVDQIVSLISELERLRASSTK
jgi:hypothetical protein